MTTHNTGHAISTFRKVARFARVALSALKIKFWKSTGRALIGGNAACAVNLARTADQCACFLIEAFHTNTL